MKVTLTFNEQRRAAYRQQGLWGDASLADYWQQTARAMPDKIAVVDNHGASYTYSALDHAASCLANWMLAKGIESGDRIAFQLPGWCEFTVIYLACLKIGAVSVPLLPSWREAELVWVLNKCQAKMFFANNNASGYLLREGVIKIAGAPGGIFNTNGLIRSFWYVLL